MDNVLVRVEDAHLVTDGAPGSFVVSNLADPQLVAERVATAGGQVSIDGASRLRAVVTAEQLINAAGRVDPDLGRHMRSVVEPAVQAWLQPRRSVALPGGSVLEGAGRPLVMGIVNVTPDSFSDGGTAWSDDDHPGAAVRHARALIAAGADILDIGGESTRPGAEPVAADEERRRVIPVIESLAEDGCPISIDTSKAAVAQAALDAGAVIVNDVTAGRGDPELLDLVAERKAPYVLMHMRGNPQTMQDDVSYDDVVAEVYEFLAIQAATCRERGVDSLLIDPGIGFGKGAESNLRLLAATREFAGLGHPVLVGASRKSFIGTLTGVDDPSDRLGGSLAVAALVAASGAAVVRVHDVGETVQAVTIAAAMATGQGPWTASS